MESDTGFKAALEEARQGRDEGGVPIGAVLVDAQGKILGRGHNLRVQRGSNTLHVRKIERAQKLVRARNYVVVWVPALPCLIEG